MVYIIDSDSDCELDNIENELPTDEETEDIEERKRTRSLFQVLIELLTAQPSLKWP